MRTLRIDTPFPARSAEEVWAALVDPSELSTWLGGRCSIEPFVGGAVVFDLPEEDLVATGEVRSFGPPHVLEHTFVDATAPDVVSVCTWSVTRSADGALLTFTQEGVTPSGAWAHVLSPAASLLSAATRVLLISFIGDEVPRALLEAGFEVWAKTGPNDDQWALGSLDGDIVRWANRTSPPPQVDVVHLDVSTLFDEYLDVAVALGASTYWFHSARTQPPEPHDDRGTWVPRDVSLAQRVATEARGLHYVDDVYLAAAARRVRDRGAPAAPNRRGQPR